MKITNEAIQSLGQDNIEQNYTTLFVNPNTSVYGVSLISEIETTATVIDCQLAGLGEGKFAELNATKLDLSLKNKIQPRRYKLLTQDADGRLEISYQDAYFMVEDDEQKTIVIDKGSSNESFLEQDTLAKIEDIFIPVGYESDFNVTAGTAGLLQTIKTNLSGFESYADITISAGDEELVNERIDIDFSRVGGVTTLLHDNVRNEQTYGLFDLLANAEGRFNKVFVDLHLADKINQTTISEEVTDDEEMMIVNALKTNYTPVNAFGYTWDDYYISVKAKAETEYGEVGKGIVILIRCKHAGNALTIVDDVNDVTYVEAQ